MEVSPCLFILFINCSFRSPTLILSDSYKNYLVAIIVPDVDVLLAWAKRNGLPVRILLGLSPSSTHVLQEDSATLCADPKVKNTIFRALTRTGAEANVLVESLSL